MSKERFFLFLRPFKSISKLAIPRPAMNYLNPLRIVAPAAAFENTIDLEERLEQSLRPFGPLVTVAESVEGHFGAGIVNRRDEAWQDAVARCMSSATLILVVPSVTSGSRWEVDQLVGMRYLSKTIFIMAPGGQRTYHRRKFRNPILSAAQKVVQHIRDVPIKFDARFLWEEFCSEYDNMGKNMPVYCTSGGLFMAGPGQESKFIRYINPWHTRKFRKELIASTVVLNSMWNGNIHLDTRLGDS